MAYFIVCFFGLTPTYTLISSTAVLPTGYAMLHYRLDAELSLQP
jgi:hypothetical protein